MSNPLHEQSARCLLIRAMGEYADKACHENIGLRIELKELREILSATLDWASADLWFKLHPESAQDEVALRILNERKASLFVAVEVYAKRVTQEPAAPRELSLEPEI